MSTECDQFTKIPLNKYGSIEQFRHVMKEVTLRADYQKTDSLPVIDFTGTVKLHGTNAAIGYIPGPELFWCQSRKNIITPGKTSDNAGFAAYFEANRRAIVNYIKSMFKSQSLTSNDHILIFGEWCGKGVQKGVGIAELSKRFIVFEIQRVSPDKSTGAGAGSSDTIRYRYPIDFVKKFQLPDSQIWNIYQFKQWKISVDFNNPKETLVVMQKLTDEVENECPVAKYFGVAGTGEGIVWRSALAPTSDYQYIFKVKGEKHRVTKPKRGKKIAIDPEKVTSINDFVQYAVAEGRLEQGWGEVIGDDESKLTMRTIGNFLKWVSKDVAKEEKDTLAENNLTMKDVSKSITCKARTWFKAKLDSVLLN